MPEYQVKFRDEAAWIGVATSLAALVTAILTALDIDAGIAAPAGVAVGAFARLIVGSLLPSPAP